MAVIFKKKEFDEIPQVPARLFVKYSNSEPSVLEATLQSWNDNYAGVVVSGRDDSVLNVLTGIASASSKIEIGIEVMGRRESMSFGSRGSTKAVETAFEKCKLAKPS